MEFRSSLKVTKEGIEMVIELNRDNYEEVTGEKGQVVLVDFWGPKCAPCLALMPAVAELEKQYEGRVKITKLDSTGNRMLCAKLRVMGLPTFIIYKDGDEKERLSGEGLTIETIKEALDNVLST
jgi:thioredoxin 1